MDIPEDLEFTAEHEWIRRNDDSTITVGITDYAQDQLGDVVFVELQPVDTELDTGAILAEVESTKSVAEVYSPVKGKIVEVNEALVANPELVNSSPYGTAWFVRVEVAEEGDVEFLNADAYRKLID